MKNLSKALLVAQTSTIVSFPEETILSGACYTIFDENRIGVKIDILLKRRLVIVIRKSDKQKVKIRKLSRNK